MKRRDPVTTNRIIFRADPDMEDRDIIVKASIPQGVLYSSSVKYSNLGETEEDSVGHELDEMDGGSDSRRRRHKAGVVHGFPTMTAVSDGMRLNLVSIPTSTTILKIIVQNVMESGVRSMGGAGP
jgi:hypothetical protein